MGWPSPAVSLDEVGAAAGRVLVIGFGRFAQVVSQSLLARRVDISLLKNDVEMIQAAGCGFNIYHGDHTRLEMLRASGAGEAVVILVCVDKPEVADRIVEQRKVEFPLARQRARKGAST